MKVEIVDLSTCKKEISIELPAERVSAQFDRFSKMLSQNANIPGFRRGKAPMSLVKTRFRKEIQQEVIRDTVPEVLKDLVAEYKLRPIGEPVIEELVVNDRQPLILKVQLEVVPNIELKDYKGLPVTKKVRIITDEMVQKRLDALKEQHSSLQPVEDRTSQAGDFVTVDLKGKYLNSTKDDVMAEGVQLQVGSADLHATFNENLTDLGVGAERVFTVQYEEGFNNPDLAGAELEYTVKLHSIKVKEVPELDDEFAQGLGEYEGLEDLKQKTRTQLEEAAQKEAQDRVENDVMQKMGDLHVFDVPEVLVQAQFKERIQEITRMMAFQGINPQTLDIKDFVNSQRKGALLDVHNALIIDRVAEQEQIEVTEAEIEAEISRLAESLEMSIEATKSRLTKEDALDSIKSRLRNKKTLDFLVNSAQVTEELVSSEELDRHEHDHDHDHNHDHDHDHNHDHNHEHDHSHLHEEESQTQAQQPETQTEQAQAAEAGVEQTPE